MSLYKIIVKLLSRCLRRMLNEKIYPSQGAFLEWRPILDVVLIANEIVDEKMEAEELESFRVATFLFECPFRRESQDNVTLGPCG